MLVSDVCLYIYLYMYRSVYMYISTLLSLIFFPLYMTFFSFLEIIISRISPFIVYGNLNRFCILLLCDYCISINYVELFIVLFRSAISFSIYLLYLLLSIFILLIFESLILKLQLKILINLLKNNYNI